MQEIEKGTLFSALYPIRSDSEEDETKLNSVLEAVSTSVKKIKTKNPLLWKDEN